MYGLKRQEAEAIGYEDEPYDALLDEFEPGAKTKDLVATLAEVREFLVPLVQEISEAEAPSQELLQGPYLPAQQDQLGLELVKAMGFDLDAGRLDISNHPFTSGIHSGDTRLTTRYKDELSVGLFGTLHEAGHGLYEQNLPERWRRTPIGTSTSLGIHESQSRMWENLVGRSRGFWAAYLPRAQEIFPEHLGKASVDDIYRAVNVVRPSFIRIEADEVTYNLHIILRVELERELISGTLEVKDLPEAWNTRFQDYLGITPPSNDVGMLQGHPLGSGVDRVLRYVFSWQHLRIPVLRSRTPGHPGSPGADGEGRPPPASRLADRERASLGASLPCRGTDRTGDRKAPGDRGLQELSE